MDNNRKTAYSALIDIEEKKSFSNLVLNHQINKAKPDSPAFVRELVYGVLENKMLLDYIISTFLKNPGTKIRKTDLTILRMGIYQMEFMNSVPPYAAVNESVLLAKRFARGRDGFINGILRSYLRKKDSFQLPDRAEDLVRFLSVKYSYEPWIIEQFLEEYEEDFVEALLAAGNERPDLCIRPNLLKTSQEALVAMFEETGVPVYEGKLVKTALRIKGSEILSGELYRQGLFSVQDESSMYAVNMLDPQPGELVVDVCAAPGGKTLYIAEKMKNQGRIISGDIYAKKLEIINQEANRIGAEIVTARAWDAARVDETLIDTADRVLADVPCSGLGVVRRKPEIKYKKLDMDLRQLPLKQFDILSAASKYVKKGGVLVYSTCTISIYENQRVVGDFIRKNPEFSVQDKVQLLPNVNGTDGFYICKMIRNA